MAESSYDPPEFSEERFLKSTDAVFKPAAKNGVAPGGFYSTSNLPTYVKLEGKWKIAHEQRMDSVIVNEKNELIVREISKLKKGNFVLIAESADGSEGVFEHYGGFGKNTQKHGFMFMSSEVSREKPVDYSKIASMIESEKKNGFVIWVIGPALVHSGSRNDFSWLVENGYVSSLFCGNAVAVHDCEMSMFGTSLDMKCDSGLSGNHGTHMKAINEVRNAGSLKNAVEKKIIKDGIIFSCIKKKIPMVIAGSIRDDGPMPETITDSMAAQDKMRELTKKATLVVMLSTALHSIATGNVLPSYCQKNGKIVSLPIIAVDQDEFVLSKLIDRGTSNFYGVVANSRDFLKILVNELKQK